MRFYIPFEHGAWWSFFSTLVGGAVFALALGAPLGPVLSLALGLSAGFVAQDWAQALLGAVLQQRSQAVSEWRAWQGWALALLALLATLAAVWWTPERGTWLFFLSALGLALLVTLALRVRQSGRGRSALPLAAVLLASPALAMAGLADGFGSRSWAFFLWPALYYPAVTLLAQAYIRGLPIRWRYAGTVLLGGLSLLALTTHAYLAAATLLFLSVSASHALWQRWRLQPQGLPSGEKIRAFGRRQAVWGVGLTLLWLLESLKGPF